MKYKNLKTFIGFDVSSTTIGYGIIYFSEGKIIQVDSGYYKPLDSKQYGIFNSLSYVQQNMSLILNHAKFTAASLTEDVVVLYPVIEDFLLGHHKTTAQTITKLAAYNTTVSMVIFNELQKFSQSEPKEPKMLAVATIRACLRKMSKLKEVKKEDVPNVVETIIKRHHLTQEWVLDKPLNKKKNIMKEFGDVCDGLAAALAGMYKMGDLI